MRMQQSKFFFPTFTSVWCDPVQEALAHVGQVMAITSEMPMKLHNKHIFELRMIDIWRFNARDSTDWAVRLRNEHSVRQTDYDRHCVILLNIFTHTSLNTYRQPYEYKWFCLWPLTDSVSNCCNYNYVTRTVTIFEERDYNMWHNIFLTILSGWCSP